MKAQIQIDKEKNLAQVIWSGSFSLSKYEKLYQGILSHPDYISGMKMFWDVRELDLKALDIKANVDIGNIGVENFEKRGAGKIAVLVGSDLQFGLMRMFKLQHGDTLPIELIPFWELEKAEAWLAE